MVANRLRQVKQRPECIEENRFDHVRSISIEQLHEAMILSEAILLFKIVSPAFGGASMSLRQ